MTAGTANAAPPRWVHFWAVATACAALPLLLVGAEVTTRGVGMADPIGFRWPWEAAARLVEAVRDGNFALAVELTHRMFGFLVGVCAIVLCVGLLAKGRGWKRWLGVAVLAAVVAQGLLGRYRVDLNVLFGDTLKLVHGCFAHLVFALLVAVCVLTSRAWTAPPAPAAGNSARLRHASLLVVGLIYLQLVLGGLVRHNHLTLGARGHLLGAFVVVAAVAWLVKLAFEPPRPERQGTRAVVVLAALVGVQLLLGIESWLSKFMVVDAVGRQVPPLPVETELLRSAHYLVGALTFAAAVTAALLAHRQAGWASRTAPAPAGRLEGAA